MVARSQENWLDVFPGWDLPKRKATGQKQEISGSLDIDKNES